MKPEVLKIVGVVGAIALALAGAIFHADIKGAVCADVAAPVSSPVAK